MNKNLLKFCYSQCKGVNHINSCNTYFQLEDNQTCVWYETILDDLDKLKNNKGFLTFPVLEDIILENFISEQYDENSLFLYDSKKKALLKQGKVIAYYEKLPGQWKQYKNVHEI